VARGGEQRPSGVSGEVQLLGDAPEDRIGSIWPSDHAGLAAQLRLTALHPDS